MSNVVEDCFQEGKKRGLMLAINSAEFKLLVLDAKLSVLKSFMNDVYGFAVSTSIGEFHYYDIEKLYKQKIRKLEKERKVIKK